jgi:hypothetical protein
LGTNDCKVADSDDEDDDAVDMWFTVEPDAELDDVVSKPLSILFLCLSSFSAFRNLYLYFKLRFYGLKVNLV